MKTEQGPKLVLIVGASRSGSTLLDRLIGAVPGFRSLGEVHQIWRRGFLANHKCGCGQPFSECPFWRRVSDDLPSSVTTTLALDLQAQVVSNRSFVSPPRTSSARYVEMLERLYESISTVSESPILIDSSKRPAHANLLLRHSRLDITVIHLVRDSRAMAFSCQRLRRKTDSSDPAALMMQLSPAQAARAWLLSNVLAEIVGLKSSAYLRVRYEDLVTSPRVELTRILSKIGCDHDLSFLAGNEAALPPAHTISGNPMRMVFGQMSIRADEEWRHAMADKHQRKVLSISWPLLLRYGYSLGAKG